MNNKRSFLDIVLPVDRRIHFDLIIIAIVTGLTILFPFASYQINRVSFNFPGHFFLTGITVGGGTVHVAPEPIMLLIFVFAFLAIAFAICIKWVKAKLWGILLMLLGAIQLAFAVLMGIQMGTFLTGLRFVEAGWGLALLGVCGALLMARGFYTLYRINILNALDLMVLPIGIYLLINNYFPMFGMFIAFKDVRWDLGIWASPWAGLRNFRFLFSTTDAWIITRNTLGYNLIFIVVSNVVGIFVGLLLANLLSRRFQKFYQTSILMPQLISWVIVGYIVFGFLSNETGMIPLAIVRRGGDFINFYAQRRYWPFILTLAFSWRMIGFQSVIYLAAISGIDRNLYEAASIDGANRIQQIRHVTLPLIKPTVITLVLIQVGRIFFSDFGLFFQVPMNAGMLYQVTTTIDVYVYRMLMLHYRVGLASAAGVYQSMVGFVFVLTANWLVRRFNRENALF